MKLTPARVEWRDDNLFNVEYGDVYFSRAGGSREAEHVFLAGNELYSRWRDVRQFAIGELGFGTGLNFLVTLRHWRAIAPADAHLHYVAIERAPLTLDCARAVWARFPELHDEAALLASAYPEAVAGFHRRVLCAGRVSLTLVWGEASEVLPQLDGVIDAWYLDGFAPRCNPDMWQMPIAQQLARLSRAQTTVATYSVAAVVRDALQASGFAIEKRPGFGAKREMLVGRLQQTQASAIATPWFARPESLRMQERRVAVIGAGIAGITAAQALAWRGWHVDLIDSAPQVATGASGNPAAIVTPLLSVDMSPHAQFNTAAFLYSSAWLAAQHSDAWFPTGVIERLNPAALDRLALERVPDSIAQRVGSLDAASGSAGALCYPRGGWVDARAFCAQLAEQIVNLTLHCQMQVERLSYVDGRWLVTGHNGTVVDAPCVVIATGATLPTVSGVPALPLQAVRGQLTQFEAHHAPNVAARPICGDGYAVRLPSGQWCAGASYDATQATPTPLADDTARNRARLSALTGIAAECLAVVSEHVGFRAVAPDRFPLVGAVADTAWFHERYADLRHGRAAARYPRAQYLPGLYVTAGHGSRGFSVAPYAAQWLADLIEGGVLPGPRRWLEWITPARFVVRALKKRDNADTSPPRT